MLEKLCNPASGSRVDNARLSISPCLGAFLHQGRRPKNLLPILWINRRGGYTGCIIKNLTLYINAWQTKPTFGKWSSLIILLLHLSLDWTKVLKNVKCFKMNYLKVLQTCFVTFLVKILSIRFLLTHPVYRAAACRCNRDAVLGTHFPSPRPDAGSGS